MEQLQPYYGKSNLEKLCQCKAGLIPKWQMTHNNRYDYSKVVYVNKKTKVTITCPKHGDFEQVPQNHTRGNGCLKCWQEYRNRRTPESFIKAAQALHGNQYDYSKVVYLSARIKVTITCPKHGDFEQLPSNHLQDHGCSKCNIGGPKRRLSPP